MRKLLLTFGCSLLMGGLVAAAEVTLITFDHDKKEVTVKDGNAEHVYRITDATKFVGVDIAGNSRAMSYDDAVKGLSNSKSEGKLTFNVTVKDGEIVEARMRAKKLK